jgi:hypothetical protein
MEPETIVSDRLPRNQPPPLLAERLDALAEERPAALVAAAGGLGQKQSDQRADTAQENKAKADALHRLTPKAARSLSLYGCFEIGARLPSTDAFADVAPLVKDNRTGGGKNHSGKTEPVAGRHCRHDRYPTISATAWSRSGSCLMARPP